MPNTGALKRFQLVGKPSKSFAFSAETEVWELSNENNKIINPTLSSGYYERGMGIYPVDFDYCRKN